MAEAFGVAVYGLLHAAVAGAVVLAGLGLGAPDLVDVSGPLEAIAQAIAFGLASLRVPLESGEIQGTFAPLTGLALALWGLVSGIRRLGPAWPGGRARRIAAVAGAFAGTCAVGAALAGSLADLAPSVPGAALAGLGWGALAGALGTRARGTRGRLPVPHPGVVAAAVSSALAGAWFLIAVTVQLAGLPLRGVAGGALLAAAALPNAAVALASVGLGAAIELVLTGTALADPVSESMSLWDWLGSSSPPYVPVLVLAPLAGSAVAARAAGRVGDPGGTRSVWRVLRSGAWTGAVAGLALAAAGWAGSFAATASGGPEQVSIRLGSSPIPVLALGVAWGVAGAYASHLAARPRRVKGS